MKNLETNPGRIMNFPKWDLDEEFLNVYSLLPVEIPSMQLPDEYGEVKNKRKSTYIFLDQLDTEEHSCNAYENIITKFICAGIRVKDIESDTLRNIYAFGAKGAFFEEDQLLISDFCQTVLFINHRFATRPSCQESKLALFGGRKDKHHKWDQLVILLDKVLKKIDIKCWEKFQNKLNKEETQFQIDEIEREKEEQRLKLIHEKEFSEAK